MAKKNEPVGRCCLLFRSVKNKTNEIKPDQIHARNSVFLPFFFFFFFLLPFSIVFILKVFSCPQSSRGRWRFSLIVSFECVLLSISAFCLEHWTTKTCTQFSMHILLCCVMCVCTRPPSRQYLFRFTLLTLLVVDDARPHLDFECDSNEKKA